jgi:predicted GTPase
VAARACGARELVDPRPFAEGTIAEVFARYPHLGPVLPALGYSAGQRRELEATIARCRPEVVVDASPARLDRVVRVEVPLVRVRYSFQQRSGPPIESLVDAALARWRRPA